MASFQLTHAAKSDLRAIGRHTENTWGRTQRNTYLSMLDRCFQDLADSPLKGRDCSDIRAGYRKYSAGGHVIFYRQIAAGSIEIVRVLHTRMDVEHHVSES